MWSKFIKDYCAFTKRERSAVLVLAALVLLFFVLPYFIPDHPPVLTPLDMQALAQKPEEVKTARMEYRDRERDHYEHNGGQYLMRTAGHLFYFDPNTLAEAEWRKLGIADRTIRTIRKYISKGGRFKNGEALAKIYGLRPDEVLRLKPYVRIGAVEAPAILPPYPIRHAAPAVAKPPVERAAIIDINAADTAAFISLPGIGSRLASRIVHFREKLGGFYSVAQLSETYGLPEATFQEIRSRLTVTTSAVHTIDLNHIEANELKEHPYVRWSMANAIIAYRRQHGNFTSKEQLLNIAIITPEQYNRLAPYLTVP